MGEGFNLFSSLCACLSHVVFSILISISPVGLYYPLKFSKKFCPANFSL